MARLANGSRNGSLPCGTGSIMGDSSGGVSNIMLLAAPFHSGFRAIALTLRAGFAFAAAHQSQVRLTPVHKGNGTDRSKLCFSLILSRNPAVSATRDIL